jgi:hypothetical protein
MVSTHVDFVDFHTWISSRLYPILAITPSTLLSFPPEALSYQNSDKNLMGRFELSLELGTIFGWLAATRAFLCGALCRQRSLRRALSIIF